MAGNFVSPGVYTIENDLSQYTSLLSSTICGIVGTADTGPTNVPTLVTSAKQYVNLFGNVSPDHYMGYAALAYLNQGNQLWVTRVAPPDAKYAKVSFPIPIGYKAIAGQWTLSGQTNTSLTLQVSDYATLSSPADHTIVLPLATSIPDFDFTDLTGISSSNGKLGSDLNSFITTGKETLVEGGVLSVTLGAGNGKSATITGIATGSSATSVAVTVPTSAFPVTNSPATATAVGEIMLSIPGSWTPPADDTPLIVLGLSSVATLSTPIKLVYHSNGSPATLKTDLDSVVLATKFAALEGILEGTASSVYNIQWPIYDPTVAGNNSLSLDLLDSILSALLLMLNQPAPPTGPNSLVFYNGARALVSAGVYGLGSITTGGASQGFYQVDEVKDVLGNVLGVRLYSMVMGALGTFKYSDQTPAPVSPVLATDQTISGTFTTNLYRPSWLMSQSGASLVPTYLKLSSIGETDESNISVVLNFLSGNTTSKGSQIYTVDVYQRLTGSTVPADSTVFSDFTLIEEYSGAIDVIVSSINSNSRTISAKLDYTTLDTLDYSTGVVTDGVPTDGLSPTFVLLGASSGQGVLQGLKLSPVTGGFVSLVDSQLLGGSSGSDITSSDVIGDQSAGTGLYAFSNPEQLDINLLIAPGWSADPSVAKAMIQICSDRGDSFAIIDPPFGLSVQGVISYRTSIQNINSSYGSMYYPWVEVTDSVNGKNIFVPPSGYVAGQFAYNDKTADVFFAPAGQVRGQIISALATERYLTQGDRDALYTAQINPIQNQAGFGIYIKGQKTLQTASTALDRVNVRRLFLYLRKVIASASLTFEFAPADTVTAYRLKQVATTILQSYQNKGGIQSYTIDVGPDVNTALTLSNNQLIMEISVIPTVAAEEIIEIYNILPQQGLTVISSL